MMGLLLAASAVLGLVVGSFLNVVIWRVPRGESVVSPGSACPACGHPIRVRDNIPVVSWLLLRGRCRDCTTHISARYPLVELATAIAFVALALRFGPSWALPAFLYFAAIAIALSAIDLDTKRLPNVIVLPSYPVAGALLLVPAIAYGAWTQYMYAWVGALALFAFYFVLAWIYPAGMAFGDVKLAGVVGLYLGWLGWAPLIVGTFCGFALGAVFGLALIVARRARLKTKIPFGPWMLAGAMIAVFAGDPLADLYLRLVGL